MNKKYYVASLGLLAAVTCSVSFAQTCATPTTLQSGATGVTGNSCAPPTGTGDNTVGNLCSGLNNTGPVAVYTWTHGTGTVSGSITVTPTGTWNPAIAVGDGSSCSAATGAGCDDQQDAKGNGTGANFAETTALSNEAANNTTYFLFISSFAASAAQACGAYSINVGQLPVKLQSFSIN